MFPFAFGVPLASRHNSPAVSRSPPAASVNPAVTQTPIPFGAGFNTETYAQKKANWKSGLRRVHPLFARQPQSGQHSSQTHSNTVTSDASQGARKRAKSSKVSLLTIQRLLAVCLIALSVVIVITGVIYADKTTAGGSSSTGSSLDSLKTGDTKLESIPFDDGELKTRIIKRIDTAPFPEADPLDHADADKPSLTNILADLRSKTELLPASVVAALFFYVAALPLVTMIHACAELAVFSILAQTRRRRNKASPTPSFADDDSFCDSDTEDINEEKYKHELAYPALPVSPEFRHTSSEQTNGSSQNKKLTSWAPILSVITSVLIIEGWAVINGVQIHCEFLPSGKGSKVCPAPLSKDGLDAIKGHRQLSIARVALSWVVVLVYIAQITITAKKYKLFSLRRFRRSDSTDTEASPNASSRPSSSSPRTINSILTRNRSRSNSSRRKTVRFDLEEASRRQSEKGDDVQYIPAPSDGYDNGYGLTYNYSSNYAYAANQSSTASGNNNGSDVRTPWQWQGQFEEFVNKNATSNGVNTNPVVAATLGTGLKNPTVEKTGGSFDFGLASMRRLAREENAALAHKTGFIASQITGFRTSSGLSSHPSTGAMRDEQTRSLTSGGIVAAGETTSAVVPVALSSTTAVPFKPKFVNSQAIIGSGLHQTGSSSLQRHDTTVSAMTNGRKSVDFDTIDQSGKRDVSPLGD